MDLNYFKMSQSVARALKDKKPVLALESTIFSHGLPWPTNYELAQNICKTVSTQLFQMYGPQYPLAAGAYIYPFRDERS